MALIFNVPSRVTFLRSLFSRWRVPLLVWVLGMVVLGSCALADCAASIGGSWTMPPACAKTLRIRKSAPRWTDANKPMAYRLRRCLNNRSFTCR